MWKFTRTDVSPHMAEFYIESITRKIRLSTFQERDALCPTIITLSPEEYRAFQDFYIQNQMLIADIRTYQHCRYSVQGRDKLIKQFLPHDMLQRLKAANILNPTEMQTLFLPVTKRERKEASRIAYVYLMGDEALHQMPLQTIKIGYSNNPEYREKTLQAEKPSITLLAAWQGDMSDEKQLHQRFADKRVRGEWFHLDQSDILTINQYFAGRRSYNGSCY